VHETTSLTWAALRAQCAERGGAGAHLALPQQPHRGPARAHQGAPLLHSACPAGVDSAREQPRHQPRQACPEAVRGCGRGRRMGPSAARRHGPAPRRDPDREASAARERCGAGRRAQRVGEPHTSGPTRHDWPKRPTSGGAAQVLRCVDWGDAREARAAAELVARWAPVGLADALELLSPAFTNPEVPSRAARCAPGFMPASCLRSSCCRAQPHDLRCCSPRPAAAVLAHLSARGQLNRRQFYQQVIGKQACVSVGGSSHANPMLGALALAQAHLAKLRQRAVCARR